MTHPLRALAPRRAPLALCLAALALGAMGAGCQRRTPLTAEPAPAPGGATGPSAETTPTAPGDSRAQASRRPPAGATCSGRDDCSSDQVCVEGRCEYRQTAVSGEILASAAQAQAQAGDWEGAIATYDQAFERFEARDAPVPPDIACRAAELILRTATDADARERGAHRADLCFRSTVPGHPQRESVRRAIARLRFEGLDIQTFDADQPATRFFDPAAASRPTLDAIAVEVQMPDLERPNPSHAALRELLRGETGQRAIAECFIQDWETRHARDASAELVLRFQTRLRDMGTYDVYEPVLTIEQTTTAEDGFEPCLRGALGTVMGENDRSTRGEPWDQAVRVTARLQ